MLKDDNIRLTLWLKLVNKFDYKQFTAVCEENNVEPLSALEFSHKAGMAACGMAAYPELTPAEAYLKFIQDNQDIPQAAKITAPPAEVKRGCNSCGGGKVL